MNRGDPGSAIYTVLAAGTALTGQIGGTRIYLEQAPQGATLPCVIISRLTARDTNDSPRRNRRALYVVKAITEDDVDKAEAIDDEIDTLLFDATLTVTGWGVYWCRRTTDVQYREGGPGGATMHHRGAQYEIRLAE